MTVRRIRLRGKVLRFGMIAMVLLSSPHFSWGEPLTTERLLEAAQDAKNWLLPGHDYTNQRYVALEQINTQNVQSLALRWKFATGIRESFRRPLSSLTA